MFGDIPQLLASIASVKEEWEVFLWEGGVLQGVAQGQLCSFLTLEVLSSSSFLLMSGLE